MNSNKFIFSKRYQLLLLLTLAAGLNLNTLFNDYAIDDAGIMSGNAAVKKGIKGIPEMFSHDLYGGFNKNIYSYYSGGRYRPIALSLFAIEFQFFGENPMVSHLINILSYIFLIALLYILLQQYVFRHQHEYLAFFTCLLFVAHPIHAEVIANVKSRDELITFIFMLLSSLALAKYSEKKTGGLLLIGLSCFFLALLTRESAIPFVAVAPLTAYFFFNQSLRKSILLSILLIAVFATYLTIRIQLIGYNHSTQTDVLNAPFLYATPSQAFATKVFILLKYLRLLLFPYPLSWDYGFNQIPYIEATSFSFILSLLILLAFTIYAFLTFKNKSLFSFSILYFIATILIFANFIIDTGVPLGERLLFQPSVAFCIALAAIYIKANKRFKILSTGLLTVLVFLFSAKTYTRNFEWKNNDTLNLADVISCPNSVRTNLGAMQAYIRKGNAETNIEFQKEYFKKAVYYGEYALKLFPDNLDGETDLEYAYVKLTDCYKTIDLFLKDYKSELSQPDKIKWLQYLSNILYKQGNGFSERGKPVDAVKYYQKSVELNSTNIEAWYNLGGNYLFLNDTINASRAWDIVRRNDPNHLLLKEEFTAR